MADYTYKDIKKAYKEAGVGRGRTVYLETDMASFGVYGNMDGKAVAEAHLGALMESLGGAGTVAASASSFSLCNTDKPFDPKKTPGEAGIFSECVRLQKGAERSFHPFNSFTALGKHGRDITANVSRHAWGPETPMARMIDGDALFLSLGLNPHCMARTIHHVEMAMGVPYRYTREYMHPVVRRGIVRREPFYMYAWYHECDLKINYNIDVWNRFRAAYKVRQVGLGRGRMWSYSMRDFYDTACRLMKDDIYILLDKMPRKRPYRREM